MNPSPTVATPAGSVAAAGRRSAALPIVAVLAVTTLVALGVRVAPLVEGGDRLQRQAVTEDGYLMLTIARNLAIGKGFSVAGGEIPTNGTQPLATLIFAGLFALVGGERQPGLCAVVGFQVLVTLITAVVLYFVVRRVLYRGPHADVVAALAALFWFASPSSVQHAQNGLETGLVTLLVLLTIAAYERRAARLAERFALGDCVLLGLLAGLTFLARNDACFFIAALLGVHLWRMLRQGRLSRAVGQCFVIGAVSIVVASPWLYFNISRFGHIVPVSGRAEALDVGFAHNLLVALPAMLENLSLVLRVPAAAEYNRAAQLAAGGVLLVLVLIALWQRRQLAARLTAGVGVLAIFVILLFAYYALFFGQPSFLGRYFFPAVALSAIVLPTLLVPAAVNVRLSKPAAAGAIALAALACMAFDARIYRKGLRHDHFQVVDWVKKNVPPDAWVAAVQTGTLGFYHDRAINLDGKVNPDAYEARRNKAIWAYVERLPVAYIADWAGIAAWAEQPEFARNFELIVRDEAANLAVLRRHTPLPDGPIRIPQEREGES
jgi:hypothetical protein